MRYAGEKRFNVWTALTLILLALFLAFVIYPIGMLLIKEPVHRRESGLELFCQVFHQEILLGIPGKQL